LSEGSHITCPRCNGTGHIRDTESSALQILRMVQEESMKDNTAAVHVQVPVEVTSFLLNEKRTEITKIELKQRVTVLLVPNKHLETPNYKLERLRHDDPRLENLQASYTMIEEPDDEVGITRREKPKPRQEPVIKGVLPDQPAPPAPVVPPPAPKPEPVAAAPRPAPAPMAAPAEAGSGFFGWVKKLFAGAPAAAPAIQPTTAVAPATGENPDKREGRDGRRGERGGRGERSDRGERGDRGGRGGRSGEGRSGQGRGDRGDRTERGERPERGSRRNEAGEGAAVALAAVPQGEREDRPRRPAGDRPDRGLPKAPESGNVGGVQAFSDTVPAAEGAEVGATEGERDGRRRRRRGGRGGRDRDETRTDGSPVDAVNGEQAAAPEEARSADATASAPPLDGEAAPAPASEGEGGEREDGRRRGRSRDRFRRERRPDDEPRGDAEGGTAAASPIEASADMTPAPAAMTPPSAPVPATVQAVVAAAATTVAAPVVVEPFVLPIDELQQIAQGSGLQWVNSDAGKISATQAAMAAEPKPIHVPRERKPIVMADEGPLVLVETRKDLSQLKLPFEQPGSPPSA
jgi:ribonuclease E